MKFVDFNPKEPKVSKIDDLRGGLWKLNFSVVADCTC